MKCLYCGEQVTPVVSWGKLILKEVEMSLCEQCEGKLERMEGECCIRCSRSLSILTDDFRRGDYCYDCVRWEEDSEWSGILTRNVSLYIYNDFLKGLISRYKFRGDYVLAGVFREKIREAINGMESNFLVPIPLSDERLYERGFNQAEALIVEAGLSPTCILKRVHTEKQSQKSRNERIHLQGIFQFVEKTKVVGKKIVLIDDIYTTGSTLRHAGKVLKEHGAEVVSSITVARG